MCEVGSLLRRTVCHVVRQGGTSKDSIKVSGIFVWVLMLVGQMSCFVDVHEASRNVVVHHPHLISRLLFPLIGFFFFVCTSVQ